MSKEHVRSYLKTVVRFSDIIKKFITILKEEKIFQKTGKKPRIPILNGHNWRIAIL